MGHMQVCISLQSDNHANTPPLSFLQAGCPSCRPTNSVKALKAWRNTNMFIMIIISQSPQVSQEISVNYWPEKLVNFASDPKT